MKLCSVCRIEKRPTDFHRDATKRDGRRTTCKGCAGQRTAAWKAADDERRRAKARAEDRARRARDLDAARRRARITSAARRARLRGAFVEHVDPLVVWERDGGVCGICGAVADPADWHLDHVVPLAAGGAHSYANVQVSHPPCNQAKGARAVA